MEEGDVMANVQTGYVAFCQGIQDSISLHRILLLYIQSHIVRNRTVKCVLVNGIIFLGSIFFFDYVVIPIIHLLGLALKTDETPQDGFRDHIDMLVFIIYQGLWMYPIYCVSFILNTIWYQELADEAYLQTHGTARPAPVKDMIIDEVYRAILVYCFLLQTMLSYLIPIVGPFLSFVQMSWLYALYCFEYKWSLHGWSIDKRLVFMEKHWTYFAGFGCPFTLATYFAPNFVSKGIFALLFPLFLLLATVCDPSAERETTKLPLFAPSRWLTLQLVRRISSLTGIKQRPQPAQPRKIK
ncbi:Etoposide induced 2.4 mRNA [Aphanomyces cochlioides]|nr:Etoposide induced 2.4 mRNA [Aphanomyces cochlioides]